jgi:signal transduction histidine kinase
MRRGLTGRMVIASGLLAIIVTAAFSVLFLAITTLRETTDRRRETREELIAADRLEKLVIDLETGLRGFVITGEEQFLEPWDAARAAVPERARALERLVADDPIQLARARRIVRAATIYIQQYAMPLVGAVRQNDASVRSVARTEAGKRRVDALRTRFDGFTNSSRALLTAREADADIAARRATIAAAVGVSGSIFLILVFTGYLTRVIVRPLRRAALMSDRLAGGDLTARMRAGGVAEIGALERSCNAMAGSLERSRGEQARLLGELAASRARIVAAADETRRQIERDLHDGTQQRLVSLGLALRAAEANVPPGLVDLRADLLRTASGLSEAVEDLQEISRGIHPAILSRGGLAPALETLAGRAAVPVELEARLHGELPESVEVAAYYVVSEALTNAAKHAQASVVQVEVANDDSVVELAIRDDGVGGAEPARGSGLIGLRDRVEALGGSIEITSTPAFGTSLLARIPTDGTWPDSAQPDTHPPNHPVFRLA